MLSYGLNSYLIRMMIGCAVPLYLSEDIDSLANSFGKEIRLQKQKGRVPFKRK
jgi:hypothetical protein